MAKFLKISSLALVLLMMFSMTTFAAELSAPSAEIDKDAKTVEISGTVTNAAEDQQVVILVVKSSVANLGSVSDSDIAYIDQVAANADGSYTIPTFGIDTDKMETEKFTAYIGGTGVSAPKPVSVDLGAGNPGDCAGLSEAEGGPGPDGEVGLADYVFIISNYKKSVYNDDPKVQAQLMIADFDENKEIGLGDYVTVISNYKKVYN